MKTFPVAIWLLVAAFCVMQPVATAAQRQNSHRALSPKKLSPKNRAAAEKPRRDQVPENRHARAGNAHCVAPWAKLAYGPKYQSYYVGGSQASCRTPLVCQHPRQINEGTWGTDYAPSYSRVKLNWTHGQLYQGGTGQYEPDHRNNPFRLRFAGPQHEHHAHEPIHGHHEPYEQVEPLGVHEVAPQTPSH